MKSLFINKFPPIDGSNADESEKDMMFLHKQNSNLRRCKIFVWCKIIVITAQPQRACNYRCVIISWSIMRRKRFSRAYFRASWLHIEAIYFTQTLVSQSCGEKVLTKSASISFTNNLIHRHRHVCEHCR